MNRNNKLDIFSATNGLKILSYLAINPGKEFSGSEIQLATALSRAGVYIALRELIKQKLVCRTRKGKFNFYSVVHNNPVVRQFKLLMNTILLTNVISKLKPMSKKIILYGSAARGEDDANSDIDLFILSPQPEAVKKVLATIRIKRKIQSIVKSPTDLVEFKETEKVFYDEINRGITIWEESE